MGLLLRLGYGEKPCAGGTRYSYTQQADLKYLFRLYHAAASCSGDCVPGHGWRLLPLPGFLAKLAWRLGR